MTMRNTTLGLLLGITLGLCSHAGAQTAANKAKLLKSPPDAEDRKELLRVQIVLDRSQFRPGRLDGMAGEFTQKAAVLYNRARQLPEGALIDTSSVPEPYTTYTVTEEDVKWIGKTASSPPEQAKLKRMPYADVWEMVAEKFHSAQGFVRELNPELENQEVGVGTVFRVPDVAPFSMGEVETLEKQRIEEKKAAKAAQEAAAALVASATPSEVPTPTPSPTPTPAPPRHKLTLDRTARVIEVQDANGQLVACFPCTPGSSTIPVPEGTWKVLNNILMPYFRYDKSVLKSGVPSDNAYNIPPGPNNYVGIVWIGINRRSVGMHGTNNPDQIGRNESSGCIRLANWDALLLSQMVDKGTLLEVH
jgi:lipoprotein-anchoring transpeptidase ErfK/SrfK